MAIRNIEYVAISPGHGWVVNHHRLPTEEPYHYMINSKEYGGRDGMSIWDLMFTQDMFQADNERLKLCLDIGWLPHADPDGRYQLLLLKMRTGGFDGTCLIPDWDNPIIRFTTTRSSSINEIALSILERNVLSIERLL